MTMLRGDVLREAALLVGAYARRDGGQLGPQVSLTLREGEVHTISGRETLRIRDRIVPLLRLAHLFGLPEEVNGRIGNSSPTISSACVGCSRSKSRPSSIRAYNRSPPMKRVIGPPSPIAS